MRKESFSVSFFFVFGLLSLKLKVAVTVCNVYFHFMSRAVSGKALVVSLRKRRARTI